MEGFTPRIRGSSNTHNRPMYLLLIIRAAPGVLYGRVESDAPIAFMAIHRIPRVHVMTADLSCSGWKDFD